MIFVTDNVLTQGDLHAVLGRNPCIDEEREGGEDMERDDRFVFVSCFFSRVWSLGFRN